MQFLTGTPSDVWEPIDIEGSLRRADLTPFGAGRAPGLHLGAIIHTAKVAAGERVGEVVGDQPSARVQEGFLFETAIEYVLGGASFDVAVDLAFKRHMGALRSDLCKQITLELDGIHGTPDWLDPTVPELVSIKSTRRSLRYARAAVDFEEQFWTWVMQEKGYLKMAGLQQVRWIVWWQAGDYSKGRGTGPQILTATARFTDEELDANWRGVCTIAAWMRAAEGVR